MWQIDLVKARRSRVAFGPGPDLLLRKIEKPGEDHKKQHYLQADTLPRLQVRLSRPHEERRDIALKVYFAQHWKKE
jgi:hypothetical protein